jgi:hypothetical protein
MIRADLAALLTEQRVIDTERQVLERQRDSWRLAQERLHELDRWVRTVATNLETLDYAGKRLALNASQVQVRVWATDHAPRWEATMHLGGDAAMSFLDTTSRGCTRCSLWRSHVERAVHPPGDGRANPSGSCTPERPLAAAPGSNGSRRTAADRRLPGDERRCGG